MTDIREEIKNALRKRNGDKVFNALEASTVAVCGLGGLGSNITVALARAGVGKLILIDFDTVDISNLNRQQYKVSQLGKYKTDAITENISEINPSTEVITHTVMITEENAEELLKTADVICEAFDKAENKAMLLDAVAERMPEKYLVTASGMAGLHSPNDIKTKKLTSRIFICGDMKSGIEDEALYSTGAMLCASHQAHTVLRILTDQTDI